MVSARGQDLTGIWRGHFRSNASRLIEYLGEEDRYKFEVQLDQRSNRNFQGVTYSYKTTVFYGKATCSGTVNPSTKKVLLEELQIVEVRIASGGDACIMTCFMQYSKNGNEEFLEGTYTSMNTRDSSSCGKGTLFLRKVTTSDFYKEPFLVKREKAKETNKKPVTPPNNTIAKTIPKPSEKTTAEKITNASTRKPGISSKNPTSTKNTQKTTVKNNNNEKTTTARNENVKIQNTDSVKMIDKKIIPITPKDLATRENELVQTIKTSATEIVVNLYDNGTIDNDTVSVYLDKKLVVSRQRLTERPITVKFLLDDTNNFHELVMVAENLGEIPPNTSLMVVNAGSRQYEVRITSTEQKNAVVNFKYEK